MPHKDDDLQELFQKAGGNYPLRTDNSNWEDVAAKLSAAKEHKIKGTRFLKYVTLFILLLAGPVIFYKFQFYANDITGKVPVERQPDAKNIADKLPELIKNNAQAPEDFKAGLPIKAVGSGKGLDKSAAPAKWYQDNNISGLPAPETVSNINPVILDQDKKIKELLTFDEIVAGMPGDIEHYNQSDKTISHDKISENTGVHKVVDYGVNQNKKSAKQPVKFRAAALKFYGTLYAAPQFSMVKFQQIEKPGYKIGVSLGYTINRRFDIEIGLQRERINFYSDGKYFNRSALKIKSDDAILEEVNGQSKITNIPVTLKYNFASKTNGHFYTAAAINAVQIMHSESYDFVVLKNGVERDRSRKYSSASDPKYFTGITASVGYEAKVCNWFNLKAEPYYQVPIQNFGVGELPVTSFGINVGIVKRLK